MALTHVYIQCPHKAAVASDFFSILLEGFYFYAEHMAEHLRPLGGPALVRYNLRLSYATLTTALPLGPLQRSCPSLSRRYYQDFQKNGAMEQKEGRNRISKGDWNRPHSPLPPWIDVDS